MKQILFLLWLLHAVSCGAPSRPIDVVPVNTSTPHVATGAPTSTQTSASVPSAFPTPTRAAGRIETLADGAARLTTGDGLSLVLDSKGQVTALALSGNALPVVTALPLVVRDLTSAASPNAPNLLANPSFEAKESGWKRAMVKGATVEVASDAAHTGTRALAIRGKDGTQGYIAGDPIAVQPGARYRVSGYFRTDFGYVVSDGSPVFWQDTLYTQPRMTTGIYFQWLNASGQPLYPQGQLAAALHWNAQEWHRLTREVVAPSGAAKVQVIAGAQPEAGTVWIDDLAFVASPELDQPLAGTLQVASDRVTQTGQVAGMQVVVTYRAFGDHIAVTVHLSNPAATPRAFDAAWGIALPARNLAGWRWWDELRASRAIEPGQDFARVVSADILGYLPVSLYPYAVIDAERGANALALALPLDSPRYALLHYDAATGRFEGRAHLATSPTAPRLKNAADFTFLLYQTDPAWGLRSAAEKHARIGPRWYDSALALDAYDGHTQGSFGPGSRQLKENNAARVYSAQYTVFEMNAQIQSDKLPRPNLQETLKVWESGGSAAPKSTQWKVSAVCDSAGEKILKSVAIYPWFPDNWAAIWAMNVDPDLPDGLGAQTLAQLKELFAATTRAGLTVDGVQIDNFISTTAVDLCPQHLAAADVPLTYDPNTYRPGVHSASAAHEYLSALRRLLDEQSPPYRGISVNFWGLAIPTLLSQHLDAFGSEGSVVRNNANWNPAILDYRRATAMGRLRLFATQESNLDLNQLETLAHEALFYGTWIIQGPNASGWTQGWEKIIEWEHAQAKPLAVLGWQPVTHAQSDSAQVWVERYGDGAFTVHNWGNAATNMTLTIDLAALGRDAANLSIRESVSGKTIPFTTTDGRVQIKDRIEPGRTAVYWLVKSRPTDHPTTRPTDYPTAPLLPTATTARQSLFAFGPFHPPDEQLSAFTGAFRALEPATAKATLDAARAARVHLLVNLTGARRYYQDAGRAFSVALFKQRLDRFKDFDFAPYVADGTLIGHILFDEPQDPTNWDGKPVPYVDVEAVATHSKQLFPTLPVGVGGPPGFLQAGAPYRALDFGFAQYTTRRGDIGEWLNQEVNAARQSGVGLVASLNMLSGNNGDMMTASQIESWGTRLVNEPYVCAVTLWKYDTAYFADPAIAQALAAVTKSARGRAATDCRKP